MEDFILKWVLFKDKRPDVGKPVIVMHNDGYLFVMMMWEHAYRNKACKQWAYLPNVWKVKK